MAEVILNGKTFKHSKKYLKDLIVEVENDRRLITKLKANNQALDTKKPESLNLSLSDFDSIEIDTSSTLDLAIDAIDSCSKYIQHVTQKIQSLIELYAKNDTENANILFNEVLETLDLFIQLVAKIYKTLKLYYPKTIIKSRTIQDLEIHLLSVLKALLPAKEKNDIIMLQDLLEYELMDNLTQWKIKALPELKNYHQV